MTETLTLEVNYRTDLSKGRTRRIRREGYATGSVFGNSSDPIPIEVNLDELRDKIKNSEGGVTSLIDLKINGAPENMDGKVIVKSFTKDHLSRKVLDVSFQRVSMESKVCMNIPVQLDGDSIGTRRGGVVEQITKDVQVCSKPEKIPPQIKVDVTNLNVGHHISIADIDMDDEDIEIMADPDMLICTCVTPHTKHQR